MNEIGTGNQVSSLRDFEKIESHFVRKLKHTVNKVLSLRDFKEIESKLFKEIESKLFKEIESKLKHTDKSWFGSRCIVPQGQHFINRRIHPTDRAVTIVLSKIQTP
jgi:hypothetical protein